MRAFNQDYLVHAVESHKDDPLVACVASATEVGIVVPSILKTALEKAGYKVLTGDSKEHEKDGFRKLENSYRCQIKDKKGVMVAHGVSGSDADALLHAVLGYLAEQDSARFGARLPNELHKPIAGDVPVANWPTTPEHRKNFEKHVTKLSVKNK